MSLTQIHRIMLEESITRSSYSLKKSVSKMLKLNSLYMGILDNRAFQLRRNRESTNLIVFCMIFYYYLDGMGL